MEMKVTFLILLLDIVSARITCSASCKGVTSDGIPFDLSALAGQEFQTVGSDQNADTYFLNVCGTSKIQCPDDAGDPPVTHGMAVQTVQAGGCYVMGQYTGKSCLWTQGAANPANPSGQRGVQLVLDNGSNNLCGDASPRQITVAFVCPAAGSNASLVPASWQGMNLPGSCEYTYTFETCAACSGGCTLPSCRLPTNFPANSNKGNCTTGSLGDMTSCTIACNPPTSASGSGVYSCRNGTLTPATLTCASPCTLPAQFPTNSSKGDCTASGILESDQSCTIECDPNYIANGNGAYSCHNGTLTPATLTCEPPPTSCCQAKPSYPKFEELCIGVSNKTTCLDPSSGYGTTCDWICGECNANTNKPQYQKYCLQHGNFSSCNALNITCHWTPISE